MSDTKISALTAATEIRPGDAVPIARAGANFFVTGAMLSGLTYASRSSNTILGQADLGKDIFATAAYTQTLTAAATLGAGWWCIIKNATTDGTSSLVIDPNGSETIDALTTLTMYSGDTRILITDGSNWFTNMLQGGFVVYTPGTYNFVVPSQANIIYGDIVGPGCGGGGGCGGSSGVLQGGTAGGGGARLQFQTRLAGSSYTPGSNIPVIVTAGGTGGAGGSSGNGSRGDIANLATNGTSFGNWTAYSGAPGAGGSTGTARSGGSGGGWGSCGFFGSTSNHPGGDNVNSGSTVSGYGGAGGNTVTGGAQGGVTGSEWGGGGGSGVDASPAARSDCGGNTVWGGAGGGAGGSVNGASNYDGAPGGCSGIFDFSGDGNTANGGTAPGGAGGNGSASVRQFLPEASGCGGGGGAGNAAGTGGNGGVGQTPGGGGGGGGGGNTTGGNGGAGGDGIARIWYS